MLNALGREIPETAGRALVPFGGAFAAGTDGLRRGRARPVKAARPGENKVLASLEDAFRTIGVRDGMTLSFHHHLRNGDRVINRVLDVAARLGLRDLTVASSGFFPVHAPLVEYIRAGVVTGLDCDGLNGPLAQAVSAGMLKRPVMLRSHGGRARAIETGELAIDVAFIAAPAADDYGNLTGQAGPTACGSLGYAFPDSDCADVVVAVTDNLQPYPLTPISIPQTKVDYVVVVDSIGDPAGIAFGSTQMTRNPMDHVIARSAARVIQAAGLLKEGFAFQTGAGGASLATAGYVRQAMRTAKVRGSFALGGITSYLVEMLDEGLFRTLFDVQSFDLGAVQSVARNAGRHLEVGASFYASPFNCGAAVNRLDATVLGATEIDLGFNANVATASNGMILSGVGGHCDSAAGAKVSIVVAKLMRKRLPIVVERVLTATTPGETIDVLVTERGVAVNPRRPDLVERLRDGGVAVQSIEELHRTALKLTGTPAPVVVKDKVVALVEYRDGTIIDVIRQSLP